MRQLLTLRLVCKQFHTLCTSHIRRLSLGHKFPQKSLAGLLVWLQQSKVSLTTFEATCSTAVVDRVLGAFLNAEMPLPLLGLGSFGQLTLFELPVFSSLAECALSSESRMPWDLTPLRSLPNLKSLSLRGCFGYVDLLEHLTSLSLDDVHVINKQDCRFVSVLEHLSMRNSVLQGFHLQGLSACHCLKQLTSFFPELSDQDPTRDLLVAPKQVSSLFHISALDLTTLKPYSLPNLSWVFNLTSLRNLHLGITEFHASFLQNVQSLSQLTKLALKGMAGQDRTLVSLDCQWQHLQALQHLAITQVRIELLPCNAVSLLQLGQLTTLSFDDVAPQEGHFDTLTAFIHRFATLRPQRILLMNQKPFCNLLEI